jgi:hypothetical protein
VILCTGCVCRLLTTGTSFVHPLNIPCFCFDQVLAAVQQAIASIKAVVAAPPSLNNGSSATAQASRDGSESKGGGKAGMTTMGGRGRGSMYTPLSLTKYDAFLEADEKIGEFASVVEEWEGRVQPKAIEECFAEVRGPGASVSVSVGACCWCDVWGT